MHMSPEAFDSLFGILEAHIYTGARRSVCGSGGNRPISAEMSLMMGLRYLGGHSIGITSEAYGCSYSAAEDHIFKVLDAIDASDNPLLSTNLLCRGNDKCDALAESFAMKSSAGGAFDGCIGVIDGWLCCINKPGSVTNPTDYFSGH